jgi:hypothetical protein
LTLLKSIVACLLLANVGYYLWARGIGVAPDAAIATPSLKLVSETPGIASAGAASMGAATPAVVAPVAAVPADAAAGIAAPAQASAPTLTAPSAAPMDSHTDEGAVPPAASPVSGGVSLDNAARCVSLGPFRDVSEAARVAGTLRGGGYDPRQRVADGEVWSGVWVYLPLPPVPAAAEQILDKLKAGGIDDALEMPGPNDTSVISLGLFSEQKRAQARVAQAQALALNPAVADRKRNGNVYWIDIDLKATDAMPNPAELQGEASHLMRLETTACPAASGQR